MRKLWAYLIALTVNLKYTAQAVNKARTADELSHIIIKNTKERINK